MKGVSDMDAKMLDGKTAISPGRNVIQWIRLMQCLFLASRMGKAVKGQVLQGCNGAFL